MGPLLLGIVVALLNWILPFPYPIDLILWVAAVILIVYGVYLLVTSDGVGRRRWW
jgi:uncharacterized protein YhhL (DUF1145 family)